MTLEEDILFKRQRFAMGKVEEVGRDVLEARRQLSSAVFVLLPIKYGMLAKACPAGTVFTCC